MLIPVGGRGPGSPVASAFAVLSEMLQQKRLVRGLFTARSRHDDQLRGGASRWHAIATSPVYAAAAPTAACPFGYQGSNLHLCTLLLQQAIHTCSAARKIKQVVADTKCCSDAYAYQRTTTTFCSVGRAPSVINPAPFDVYWTEKRFVLFLTCFL